MLWMLLAGAEAQADVAPLGCDCLAGDDRTLPTEEPTDSGDSGDSGTVTTRWQPVGAGGVALGSTLFLVVGRRRRAAR